MAESAAELRYHDGSGLRKAAQQPVTGFDAAASMINGRATVTKGLDRQRLEGAAEASGDAQAGAASFKLL